MTAANHRLPLTPVMAAAIAEIRDLIAEHYPQATFVVEEGDDPAGIYLVAMVDVEDTDEVVDRYGDRLVDLQVEAGLPVYVAALRPVERVVAEFRRRGANAALALLPV